MSESLYTGNYLNLIKDGNWEYVKRTTGKDVVYILPALRFQVGYEHSMNNNIRIVMTSEFRAPFGKNVLSFPAGLVGDVNKNEALIAAAYRELLEETGYKANRIRYLASGPSSSGLSDETIHYYLADVLEKVSDGGGDDTENITVYCWFLNNVEGNIKKNLNDGMIVDSKVYAGLYWLNKFSDQIE